MKMIEYVNGDMFERKADVRINTVNCVGAMGAGVALAFKKKYPDMFKEYSEECKKKTIRPGKPHVWAEISIDGILTIVNFPTKDHWRKPSEYRYIESGLKWLREYLKDKGDVTVTVPALGCGHGGLEWERVKAMIVNYLEGLDAKIYVYEPADTHQLNEIVEEEIKEKLENCGIKAIHPSDASYPQHFKGKSSAPLYVKGDTSVLYRNGLVILPSRKMEVREQDAITLCIDNMINHEIVYVVGYNAGDRVILKKLLEAKRKVVVCIEEGILQFRVKSDLEKSWDDTIATVVSILKPDQKWARHNLKISTELKISLGNTALISSIDPSWLVNVHKDLRNLLKNSFYMNYGSLSPALSKFFNDIEAIPVSRDPNGIPKLNNLINQAMNQATE